MKRFAFWLVVFALLAVFSFASPAPLTAACQPCHPLRTVGRAVAQVGKVAVKVVKAPVRFLRR